MATQLRVLKATADGHPVDARTGAAFALPAAVLEIQVATTAAGRVALHDGTSAAGPLLWSCEIGSRGTVHTPFSPEDLPFRTAIFVDITGIAGEVWIYCK